MTSFSWKRKLGERVSKKLSQSFEDNSKDHHDNLEEVDWLTGVPKRKVICLEDGRAKSSRLKQEGNLLAESERYWEAISKWEEALALTPNDETLHEMRAQSYLLLSEVYPAVQAAIKCTEVNPLWWVGHQTLGRAQLGMGDVAMAVKSFSRALHLYPADEELWKEDLLWAKSLLDQHHRMQAEQATEKEGCTVTEICDPPHKLTPVCATSHNSTENSDSSSTSDENFFPNPDVACDSLSQKSTDKTEHEHASENSSDVVSNDAGVQGLKIANLESPEDIKETKRLPHNYVRMRHHLLYKPQK